MLKHESTKQVRKIDSKRFFKALTSSTENWLAKMNYCAESDLCILKGSQHTEKDYRYFKISLKV
jgi:hypothetical protein